MSEAEKTEPATAKKRKDAADKGDVLRSRDLAAAMTAAAFLLFSLAAGPFSLGRLQAMLARGLTFNFAENGFQPRQSALTAVSMVAPWLSSLAVVLVATALLPLLISRGLHLGAAMPQWSRLDPFKNLKRIWGREAVVNSAMAILKTGASLVLFAAAGWQGRFAIGALGNLPLPSWLDALGRMFARGLMLATGLMLLCGALDLGIQFLRREGRLRMSKKEVGDELKAAEGGPERKRAVRERQYAIAARSARKAMAEATVVLTNPSQFAVALRYLPGVDAVPIVVARGTDEAARAIRDLAEEHLVPRVESPILARAIYFTTQVGHPVAADLFLAVATVLAFIFDLDRQAARHQDADLRVPSAWRFGADGRRED